MKPSHGTLRIWRRAELPASIDMDRLNDPFSVFITGATGFIGSSLIRILRRGEAEVQALVLPGEADSLPPDIPSYEGDVGDAVAVKSALMQARPDVFMHLAAVGLRTPNLSFQEACRVNVGGVLNALSAIRDHPTVRRLVLVGSAHEYGARRADDSLDPFSVYSASKAAAWAFARAAYNAWGAPVVWVRPFQVYGPGQRTEALIPAVIASALSGEDFAMTSGEQQRDFIFVDDICRGLIAAATVPDIEGRVLDLGTGTLRTVRAVVERLWALMDAEGTIHAGVLPYRPGEVPAIPADVARTYRLTGWRAQVSLADGLRRTVDTTRMASDEGVFSVEGR